MPVDQTDYISGIEYLNGSIQAIYHAEGRAVPDGSSWRHEYVIADHLGNTRLRFSDADGNGTLDSTELLSTHDYYPFGMEWQAGGYPYTYNGKERNEELGLEWLDYGARWYDAVIGRFMSVDPIADRFAWVSTFNYAENEPIGSIDLHGLQSFEGKDGKIVNAGPASNSWIEKKGLTPTADWISAYPNLFNRSGSNGPSLKPIDTNIPGSIVNNTGLFSASKQLFLEDKPIFIGKTRAFPDGTRTAKNGQIYSLLDTRQPNRFTGARSTWAINLDWVTDLKLDDQLMRDMNLNAKLGNTMTLLSAGNTLYQYGTKQLNGIQTIGELGVTGLVQFKPNIYTGSISIGWELGRFVTWAPIYQKYVHPEDYYRNRKVKLLSQEK